jgi:putative FmdB family regulatory protein
MPFYEYECASCKFYTEVMQKIGDAPLKKCPSCGRSTLKKLISAPVFRLKGGGWYETDFKSEQENKRNLAETASKEEKADTAQNKAQTKSEGKSEGKTEAQPETKAETAPKRKLTRASTPRKPARRPTTLKKAKRKAR